MTKLLAEAIDKVSKLPEGLQQQVAEKILEYYEELKWDDLVASPKSQAFLDRIEKTIQKDIKAGGCVEGGFGDL